jgi:hypothetical protein
MKAPMIGACRDPNRSPIMRFEEAVEGEWRIYAGAMESPRGDGYTAAAVVQHRGGTRELWRDDSLACGHRWRSADEALRYALGKAREIIRHSAALATAPAMPARPPVTRAPGVHRALPASR